MNHDAKEQSVAANAKWDTLESLATLYPWLRSYQARPLRDYAFRLFEAPASKTVPGIRLQAFVKLLDIIKKAGKRSGLSFEAIEIICREFTARPVMQTGPHLFLLIAPEAFYSHLFSLMGLSAHGCSTYLSYAVSTVNLVEKSHKGPGWLDVGGHPVNIFGLSRSRMIPYGLLAGPGCYRFELATTNEDTSADEIAQLRVLLPTKAFARPANAIKAANLRLWPRLFGKRFNFLQIDDEDIADLVADHLSDPTSWLRTRLLENSRFALKILATLGELSNGAWNGWLTRSTDFFWFYENGKRLPLRLVAGELVHPATGRKVVRFAAPDIVERLANRSLIPNLLLMFLVLSILPGVRVLGGSHHPVYYPLIRYVICNALEEGGDDVRLRRAFAKDDVPGAWGHRVIECGDDPLKLFLNGDMQVAELMRIFGEISLADACGSMSSFVRDSLWHALRKRLRDGTIAPTDAEWAFS